jgi:hypothetical protein
MKAILPITICPPLKPDEPVAMSLVPVFLQAFMTAADTSSAPPAVC